LLASQGKQGIKAKMSLALVLGSASIEFHILHEPPRAQSQTILNAASARIIRVSYGVM
jgi:hypothetical protein